MRNICCVRAPWCLERDSGSYQLSGVLRGVRIFAGNCDGDGVLGQRGMVLYVLSSARARTCARSMAGRVLSGARRVQRGRACHLPGTKF